MQKSYAEKLRDPRWQKTRLLVMDAANFECSSCGASDKTLNVHHRRYIRGRDPWDYEHDDLQCLCENCHETIHDTRQKLEAAIGENADQLLGYALGLSLVLYAGDEEFPETVKLSSYEQAAGFADALGTKTEIVISKIENGAVILQNLWNIGVKW